MNQTLVLWNDELTCRLISYRADYSIIGDMLHILELTPLHLTLIDAMTDTAGCKIEVQTDRGRDLLRSRFLEEGMLEPLVEQIAVKHDLTVITQEE